MRIKMGHFPFFVDITGKKGVILGGGRVAARKIEKLLPFSADLVCIAPQISDEISGLAQGALNGRDGSLRLCLRTACEADLQGAAFVIAATDREEVNTWAWKNCLEKGIPVNVVDDREKCTFFFPALVCEGPVTVGISSDGKSPAAASWMRKKVEAMVPSGLGETVELLGSLRELVLEKIPDQRARAACLEQLFLYCEEREFKVERKELERLFNEKGMKFH